MQQIYEKNKINFDDDYGNVLLFMICLAKTYVDKYKNPNQCNY